MMERKEFYDFCFGAVQKMLNYDVPFDGHYKVDDAEINGGYYLLAEGPREEEENDVKDVVYHCHYTLSTKGDLVRYTFQFYINKINWSITDPYNPKVELISPEDMGGQVHVKELIDKKLKVYGLVETEEKTTTTTELKPDDQKVYCDTIKTAETANQPTKEAQNSGEEKRVNNTVNVPSIDRINGNKDKVQDRNQLLQYEMSDEVLLLKAKAEAGDPKAQYQLAFHYNVGKGVKQDKNEAFYWYKLSSENGNTDAMCIVASAYLRGEMGCEKDVQKAFDLYETAEAKGNKSGTRGLGLLGLELGNMFYTGEGVEQDYYKAFQWYEYGAEKGNAEAQCSLAIMYENGDGVKQDTKKAVEWYITASSNGDKDARNRLSELKRRVNK